MKDKRAVATQTVSLQVPPGARADDVAARASSLGLTGITVHDARPHKNKLKPGHLTANRFTVVVRDIPSNRLNEASVALRRAAADGVPNAFGAQRFGTRGDNADRALEWLRGGKPLPRDPRARRLLWSSLQAAVFNAVLEERLRDGTWNTPVEGDLLKVRESGGLFVCSDVQTDRARALRGDVSPTGPIIGPKMRQASGSAGELERRIADEILGAGHDLQRARALGEGTRRPLRTWVQDLCWDSWQAPPDTPSIHRMWGCGSEHTACMRVSFVLPKGAYATTVLATAFALHEAREDSVEGARKG
jgi:tRNA pseudouridine13 synthase